MAALTMFCERCEVAIEFVAEASEQARVVAYQHSLHVFGRQGVWLVPEGDTQCDETRVGV